MMASRFILIATVQADAEIGTSGWLCAPLARNHSPRPLISVRPLIAAIGMGLLLYRRIISRSYSHPAEVEAGTSGYAHAQIFHNRGQRQKTSERQLTVRPMKLPLCLARII